MARRIDAVIFDMDGLLIDSEVFWEDTRREFCRRHGCDWRPEDEHDAKGMNSPEWAALIRSRCGFDLPIPDIVHGVAELMRRRYERDLPLLPGAVEAVHTAAERYPLAIASSSPPEIIEQVLALADLRACFDVVVSADTIGKGKPAPDVFLSAARELGVSPEHVLVFEDSGAGIRAGLAAGMTVIAVPNTHYPPPPDVLARAHIVLRSLQDLDPALLSS